MAEVYGAALQAPSCQMLGAQTVTLGVRKKWFAKTRRIQSTEAGASPRRATLDTLLQVPNFQALATRTFGFSVEECLLPLPPSARSISSINAKGFCFRIFQSF